MRIEEIREHPLLNPPAPAARLRILLVEDERQKIDELKSAARTIGSCRLDLSEAHDYSSALDNLRGKKGEALDSLVMGMVFHDPTWSGEEYPGLKLLDYLRQVGRKTLPVVVWTQIESRETRKKAGGFGDIKYLLKRRAKAQDVIQEAIEAARSGRSQDERPETPPIPPVKTWRSPKPLPDRHP